MRSKGRRLRTSRRSGPAAHHPPDYAGERGDDDEKRHAEQPERRVENGLRVHARLDLQRLAAQAIRQRLLPREDVAAALDAARVVIPNPARKVQPERDELAAGPAGGAGILFGRGADALEIDEEVVALLELIGGPGERRRL